MPAHVPHALAHSHLPALTDLELWAGTEFGGGDMRPGDLRPLLGGARRPELRRLAVRNAEQADDIAATIADTEAAAHLRELDLSLGTFGDAGADALLDRRSFACLEQLTIHHHFMGDDRRRLLHARHPHARIDISEPAKPYSSDEDPDVHYVPDEHGRYVKFGV